MMMPWQRLQAWLAAPHSTPASPAAWRGDPAIQAFVDDELRSSLPKASVAQRAAYQADDEFLVVPHMLTDRLVARIVDELPRLTVYRSLMPWARQAGSAGYPDMQVNAPVATAVYRSEVLRQWCEDLAGQPMQHKADADPHATAMYYYTKPGDWMDYHFDGCGCPDNASYTIIFGIEDQSTQHFRAWLKPRTLDERVAKVTTSPGTGIFFCGSKIFHGVSELGPGERRTVQSIAYTTGAPMARGQHYRESIKDALLYFGASALRSKHH